MNSIRTISLWNKSNVGMVNLFEKFSTMEKVANNLDEIIFYNLPVVLIKHTSETIWSWDFFGKGLSKSVKNLVLRRDFTENIIFLVSDLFRKKRL